MYMYIYGHGVGGGRGAHGGLALLQHPRDARCERRAARRRRGRARAEGVAPRAPLEACRRQVRQREGVGGREGLARVPEGEAPVEAAEARVEEVEVRVDRVEAVVVAGAVAAQGGC